MRKKEFDMTANEVVKQMRARGYSTSSIESFVGYARTVSMRFPDRESDIDIAVAMRGYNDSLEHLGRAPERIRQLRRFARYLESAATTGIVNFSNAPRAFRDPLEDGYELLLSGYRGYLKSRNASDATIVKWDGYAYRFLGYLSFVGVAAISDLAPDDVSGFVKWVTARHAATGMAGELSMLRSFLGYTDDALLTAGAEKWVPRGRNIAAAPTPTLEDGELARIVAAIDTSTSMGKRDLAIVMLALDLGVRSSDIVCLRLGDIDWDERSLSIIQAKTKKPLKLPMTERACSALSDYILHGRPPSRHREVFLTARCPHGPFGAGSAMWQIASKYFKASGVLKEGQKAGLHRLRHCCATRLLSSGATLEQVSAALGHTKAETSMMYVSLDTETLRGCCLEIPGRLS